MSNFWEDAFKEKQMMWGENPTQSAIETTQLFKNRGLKNILIPGVGYGRNAKVFIENGFTVTGIEISETAIDIAKRKFGNKLKLFHGTVNNMPFDNKKYDGIFCHALIHLLDKTDRQKLITNCFHQLENQGIMTFTTITKAASTFGVGTQINKDRFKTKDGVELFFYDEDSINEEFGNFGLTEMVKIEEPVNRSPKRITEFWKIACKKVS